jgi:hypothetical protein
LDKKNISSPEVLVDSLASKPAPKWTIAAGIIVGLTLGCMAFSSFGKRGADSVFMFEAFMSLVCIYGSGLSRKLYLSDVGVVREMRGWGRAARRVLPWNSVLSVSFAFRADKMMVFFEAGNMGWKVLFSKNQERIVRDVLDRTLPDIEVNIIGKH